MMDNSNEIIEKIKNKAEEYLPAQIEMLTQYASFDSETHYIEGNRKAVDVTKKHLDVLSPEYEEIVYENVGTHLLARINPGAPKRIIINAHLDTVFPVGFAAEHKPYRDGDRLYGLGMIDCKGGVAVSCYAVRILKDLGLLPDIEIDMLYTCDEEQGSMTGQEVYGKVSPGAYAAFVFEPGYKQDGVIPVLTSRQGVILGNLDIKGVEAHAGCDYSKGHSANKELAHKILELYSLNDDEKGIYYNAAPVSGGRPNGVVSGDANMQFCVAGIPDWDSYHECEKKLDKMGSFTNDPDCSASLTYRMLFPPQIHMDRASGIYKKIEHAASLLGLKTKEDGVNKNGEDIYAATDANYIAASDVPVLDGLGPEGLGMHTTEECVFIPSLKERTALFAAALLEL
ncbi:MAG TPA: M20/M25/M40 family metallo-hydrolase [Candidatus Alectryocaccobium stercorigallinarum]|nr:M20/M25/M40 family metallo-hydrolase [Candidatus Alectryocaccobium stercorigallinarum]